jgi:hypothetical protein
LSTRKDAGILGEMYTIPEKDWKRLRAMQDAKLALACERILDQAERIVQERTGKEHEAFLKLWAAVEEGNEEIARLFDDVRRSHALFKLMAWRKHGLLRDDELALFSAETQEAIARD